MLLPFNKFECCFFFTRRNFVPGRYTHFFALALGNEARTYSTSLSLLRMSLPRIMTSRFTLHPNFVV